MKLNDVLFISFIKTIITREMCWKFYFEMKRILSLHFKLKMFLCYDRVCIYIFNEEKLIFLTLLLQYSQILFLTTFMLSHRSS